MGIYEENLLALKSKFPEVYDWLLREEEDQNVEIIRTKSGLNNLRFRGLPGEQVYLYHRGNPLQEERERCRDLEFSADKVTFLIGMGLGYLIEAIKNKIKAGHRIIVLERNATVLKKAFAQVDMARLMEEDILIFTLPDRESLKARAMKYIESHTGEVNRLWGSPVGLEEKKEYKELNEWVLKISSNVLVLTRTGVMNGQVFVSNEIENIPKFLFSPGLRNLFRLFDKVPGIIISAGPSLERNVHSLKKAEGKALLMATAPVVRILLAYDIKPDLMISVDFAEGNRIHFEGLWHVKGIPLIYPRLLAPSIVRDFQGDMFAIQPEKSWLSHNWENKGEIELSGSVAGWALNAIIALGCDPIIFVGQDLSYSDKTHVEGSARSRKFHPACQGEVLYRAKGVYGSEVLSSERFITFLQDIERTISQNQRRFINATTSGLSIRGTEEMPLEECIEKYCRQVVNPEAILNRAKQLEKVDFGSLIKDLEGKIDEIQESLKACLRGLSIIKSIKKKFNRGRLASPLTGSLLREMEEVGGKFRAFYDSFGWLRLYLSKDLSLIKREEYLRVETGGKNPAEILERDQLIFTSACRGLKELRGKIFNLSKRLKAVESCRVRLESNPAEGRGHYRLAKVFGEIGLHGLAVEEYLKALELGQDPGRVYSELGRCYWHMEELTRARRCFEQAQEKAQDPKSFQKELEEVEERIDQWLKKAESYLQEGNWVNALLYARKVVRENPEWHPAQKIVERAKSLRSVKIDQMEAANESERAKREQKRRCADWIARGKDFFNQRIFLQAIESFKKALELGGDKAEIEVLLAFCHSEMGDLGKAQEIFLELCNQFPESGMYPYYLAQALLGTGDLVGAAKKFELAAKDKKYRSGLFEAGSLYMKVSEYSQAIRCFGSYLEVSPDSYELLGKIGTCYLAQGMLSQAKGKYREALEISSNYKPAQIGLQRIEEMEKRLKANSGPPSLAREDKGGGFGGKNEHL